jgi:hypothetical protein
VSAGKREKARLQQQLRLLHVQQGGAVAFFSVCRQHTNSNTHTSEMSATIKKSKAKGVSLSKRAGLHLPVRAIKRQVNHGAHTLSCGPETAVYLAAMLEYIAVDTVGAAADESGLCVDPKLKGVVTAAGIDGLMGADQTRTYAALMRNLVPFHQHTVCAEDEDIVMRAAQKPKRQVTKKDEE